VGVIAQSHDGRLLKLALKDGDVIAPIRVVLIGQASAAALLISCVLYFADSVIFNLQSDTKEVAELLSLDLLAQRVHTFAHASLRQVALFRVLLAPFVIDEVSELILEAKHEVVILHAKVVLVMELANAEGLERGNLLVIDLIVVSLADDAYTLH